MKTLKKVLHIILLAVLIILAASGILAIFLPIARERHVDKEIAIERVDKKKDEDEMNEDQEC
jgi:flagellar basal body-associated protein FliL